jgi:protein PhnA
MKNNLDRLKERANHICELCGANGELYAYTLSPKGDDSIDHQVALCSVCQEGIVSNDFSNSNHWRALTGSIWSETASVQALSYRILDQLKSQDWAAETLDSVFLDESTISWALAEVHASENKVVHKDAYGNVLLSGDNVVLIENLNVKGTSYTAPKGTQVKKIRLVADNAEQIEGKINNDTIVILTKFLKKA